NKNARRSRARSDEAVGELTSANGASRAGGMGPAPRLQEMAGVPSRSAKVRDLPSEMPTPNARAASRHSRPVVIAIALALALPLDGCAGRATTPTDSPVAKLAATHRAKADFHPLRQQWLNGSPRERMALEPALEEFRRRHP